MSEADAGAALSHRPHAERRADKRQDHACPGHGQTQMKRDPQRLQTLSLGSEDFDIFDQFQTAHVVGFGGGAGDLLGRQTDRKRLALEMQRQLNGVPAFHFEHVAIVKIPDAVDPRALPGRRQPNQIGALELLNDHVVHRSRTGIEFVDVNNSSQPLGRRIAAPQKHLLLQKRGLFASDLVAHHVLRGDLAKRHDRLVQGKREHRDAERRDQNGTADARKRNSGRFQGDDFAVGGHFAEAQKRSQKTGHRQRQNDDGRKLVDKKTAGDAQRNALFDDEVGQLEQ